MSSHFLSENAEFKKLVSVATVLFKIFPKFLLCTIVEEVEPKLFEVFRENSVKRPKKVQQVTFF